MIESCRPGARMELCLRLAGGVGSSLCWDPARLLEPESSSGRIGCNVWRMGGGGPGSEGGGDHEGREVSGVRKSWCTSDTLMTEPSCVNVSIPGRGMEERCAGESGREGGWELVQLLVR